MDLPSIDLVVNHIQENFEYYLVGAPAVLCSYFGFHIYLKKKKIKKVEDEIKAVEAEILLKEQKGDAIRAEIYKLEYPIVKRLSNDN